MIQLPSPAAAAARAAFSEPQAARLDPAAARGPAAARTADPLRQATETLQQNFDTIISGRTGLERMLGDAGTLNRSDLQRLASDQGGQVPPALREAAQFILDSPVAQNFLDVGAGRGPLDGRISRGDLDAALQTLDSDSPYDELLDTAAGRNGGWLGMGSGRDGVIGRADIDAALADPAVPSALKDSLRLLRAGPDGAQDAAALIGRLDGADIRAAAALYGSSEFQALSRGDQRLVAEAWRDGQGDAKVAKELLARLQSPAFQAKGAAERTAELTQYALLKTPEFQALPAADQARITGALMSNQLQAAFGRGDHTLAANIKSLIENEDFANLGADEQTAVLSQVGNYPSGKAVHNIERMLGKEWFQDFDLGDKQRALKMIGYMSHPRAGTDQNILDNTLDKFLADDAPYTLAISPITAKPGNITFGYASGDTMTINENLVTADNGRLEADTYGRKLALDTIPHEINHLINGDKVAQTFDYLNEEYRAWYVGFSADNGRPPSNEEALERWSYFLDPNSGYYDSASKGALADPAEAAKIFDLLSTLTGQTVTADNYVDMLNKLAGDPSQFGTDPNAAAAVVPPGNLDNH